MYSGSVFILGAIYFVNQEEYSMSQPTAEDHLKRAFGLVTEVDKATEEFRRSALQHDRDSNTDQPFLQMMVTTVKGGRQLSQQKSALVGDLQLANEEIDRAAALNQDATIQTTGGVLGIAALRSMTCYGNGQLELIWGNPREAKQMFSKSIDLLDVPDSHYMLGLIYEDEYKPAEALREFEKCLDLDPSGELSVPALREANAMKNYKKRFRGNWVLLIILVCLYIVPGVIYWVKKYK